MPAAKSALLNECATFHSDYQLVTCLCALESYLVDLVSVDGEVWVRNPAWKSKVAEAAMYKEHGQEGHPEWSPNPQKPSADIFKMSVQCRGSTCCKLHAFAWLTY